MKIRMNKRGGEKWDKRGGMKWNKRGGTGEEITMIYRLVLITLIAFVIFGVSAIFYDYYIDVRDVEAGVMTKKVVNCLSPNGELEIHEELCGLSVFEVERYYVRVSVLDNNFEIVETLEAGDSGVEWVRNIFVPNTFEDLAKEVKSFSGQGGSKTENLKKYEPGYSFSNFDSVYNGEAVKLNVEVWVNYEI